MSTDRQQGLNSLIHPHTSTSHSSQSTYITGLIESTIGVYIMMILQILFTAESVYYGHAQFLVELFLPGVHNHSVSVICFIFFFK